MKKKVKNGFAINQFTVDETFLHAIKSMVQDGDKRKQYLGWVLSTTLFDPQ